MVLPPESNRREFFRIDGDLYLRADPIKLGEAPSGGAQGAIVPSFSLEEDDYVGLSIDAFREHLVMSEIDTKHKEVWLGLQQLLAMMKRLLDEEMFSGKKRKLFRRVNVNISGSGVAFTSPVSYLVGQYLRLAMFFSRFPYSYVCTVGEVVKCEKRDLAYWIRCEYKDISERNQDEVLRFVNQLQRDERTKGG